MLYEVTFNRKPNKGDKKYFKEVNKKDAETDVVVDDGEMAVVAPCCSKAVENSDKSESDDDDELYLADKILRQDEHNAADKNRDILNKDLVTVRIPRIDRAGTDFKRLPGTVVCIRAYGEEMYHILISHGTLKDWYRASESLAL